MNTVKVLLLNTISFYCIQIELKCVIMLDGIVWNGTGFWHWNLYLRETDLFEIKLLICIEIDLVLTTYNGWYAIKPTQTKSYIFNIYV